MTAETTRQTGPVAAVPESAKLAILRVLDAHPRVEQAVIFGSRAKGTQRTGSDIDLALVGKALQFDDLLRLEGELDDLMLPWRIDLLLLDRVENPALREHIARVGIPLLAREVKA